MIHFRLMVSFMALGLLLVASRGPAGSFTLLSSGTNSAGKYEVKVALSPAADETADRRIFLPPDVAAEYGTDVAYRLPDANEGARAFLVAHPENGVTTAADWSVSLLDGRSTRKPLAADVASIQPVVAGTMNGVQVIVYTDRLPADGTVTLVVDGPVVGPVTKSAPSRQTDPLARLFLNQADFRDIQKPWKRRGPAPPAPQPEGSKRISYKVGDEILRVPLASLGITAGQLPTVAFLHHGAILPAGGVLGADAWLYAPRRNTISDIRDSVFLNTTPTTASLAMATRAPFLTLSAAGTQVSLTRKKVYEPNNQYERFIGKPAGERFGIHRVQAGGGAYPQSQLQLISIGDQLTSTSVQVRAELWGINATPSLNPDHLANVTINSVALPSITWDGQTMASATSTAVLGSIPAPPVSISLIHSANGTAPDLQLLDLVELQWQGYPRIDTSTARSLGRIDLPADPGGFPRRITLAGFPAATVSSEVILLDITDPSNPVRVVDPPTFSDGTGTIAVEFEAPGTACSFMAQRTTTIQAPELVTDAIALPAPLTAGTTLERIFVRPPSVSAALAPLVTARGASTSIILDPQAAYDTYNGGQESPESIRDAIRYLIENSPDRVSLPAVFLVGHGTLDRRDYFVKQSGAQIPPFVDLAVDTTLGTIENSIDFDFGFLFGSDLISDAVICRIPVRTPAELTTVLNRILAYEGQVPTLLAAERRGVFVLDNDAEFQTDLTLWKDRWEGATGKTAVVTSLATATLSAVQGVLDAELERTGHHRRRPGDPWQHPGDVRRSRQLQHVGRRADRDARFHREPPHAEPVAVRDDLHVPQPPVRVPDEDNRDGYPRALPRRVMADDRDTWLDCQRGAGGLRCLLDPAPGRPRDVRPAGLPAGDTSHDRRLALHPGHERLSLPVPVPPEDGAGLYVLRRLRGRLGARRAGRRR